MFTLKLYAWPRQHIIECESVTVYCWDHGTSWQITAHHKDASKDLAYCVGNPGGHPAQDSGCPGGEAGTEWHERAIVENSSGRTTQIIQWSDGPSFAPSKLPRTDSVGLDPNRLAS